MNPTAAQPRLSDTWPALLLVVLVVWAYWPGRGGGYVFDDFPNIVDNTALHVTSLDWHTWIAALFSSEAGTLQRPLAMLTFALNHYFTGLDPVPMKLTNIGIHALNALLVLGLMRTLLAIAMPAVSRRGREWAARFTVAAWALHPLNLMAVLFVVQRMESLAHTFVFAGLWLYLLGRQRQLHGHNGWILIGVGVLGGTALGALAKESAVLLPLYAVCIELCVLGFRNADGRLDRRLLAGYLLVLVLPALGAVAWLLPHALLPGAYKFRNFTLGERLLTEGRVVLDYLRWTLFPSLRQLSLYHDDIAVSRRLLIPWSTLPSLLGIITLLGAAAWVRSRRPLVALGVLWFLGAQLLTASFIPLELVYEHRNYFASLGICLALADLLLLLPDHRPHRNLGRMLAVAWLTALAVTTNLRAHEWSDPLRFAASEAAKHPASPRATYSHARLLTAATGYRPDSPLMQPAIQALERANAIPHSGILPASTLLVLASRSGMQARDVWWDDLLGGLRQGPVGPEEINAIAAMSQCARNGDCLFPAERMLAAFQVALLHGKNADVLNIYADYVLNVIHQPETALYLWQQAIELKPHEAQYRINRIKLLIALRRETQATQAIADLRQLGRFGENASAADEMTLRLRRSRSRSDANRHPPNVGR